MIYKVRNVRYNAQLRTRSSLRSFALHEAGTMYEVITSTFPWTCVIPRSRV